MMTNCNSEKYILTNYLSVALSPQQWHPASFFVFTSANKEISRGRQTVSASIQRHGYIYIALI